MPSMFREACCLPLTFSNLSAEAGISTARWTCRVRRDVEERGLHRRSHVTLHLAAGASLQIFLGGIAGKQIPWPDVAVAATGADRRASTLYFHLQAVAASFSGNCGLVTEKGVLILVLCDFLETAQQIIGIEDNESSGAIGELIKNLLVVRGAGRKLRNDLTRLRVRIIEAGIVSRAAGSTTSRAAAGFAAASATASSSTTTFTTSASTTASATRT